VEPSNSDLVTFLRARADEDEAAAVAARDGGTWGAAHDFVVDDLCGVGELAAAHIARHDPARVLREVEAKRRIVKLHERIWIHPAADEFNDAHLTTEPMPVCASCRPEMQFRRAQSWPCRTLRTLALPYADHPDYQEGWAR